jgi:hypothetical protein
MHGSLATILDSGNAGEKRSAALFTSLQAASTTAMLSRERRSFIRRSGSPDARISAKPLWHNYSRRDLLRGHNFEMICVTERLRVHQDGEDAHRILTLVPPNCPRAISDCNIVPELGRSPQTLIHGEVGSEIFLLMSESGSHSQRVPDLGLSQFPKNPRQAGAVGASNYGEAGAIDFFGHNSNWVWGPGEKPGEIAIIVGGSQKDYHSMYEKVQQAATVVSEYARPFETDLPVYLCRRPKVTLQQVWPHIKGFI